MAPITEREQCLKCDLGQGRLTLPGTGPRHPRLVFVGDAPDMHEDREDQLFVGELGKVLDELLDLLGLLRGQVRLTHVCKCRPPTHRDPYTEEFDACIHNGLMGELLTVCRRLVVPLGKAAMSCFLGDRSISEAAGRVWSTEHLSETLWGRLAPWGSPVLTLFPMLHPAATLHSQTAKRRFWKDAGKLKLLLEKRRRPRRKQRRPR